MIESRTGTKSQDLIWKIAKVMVAAAGILIGGSILRHFFFPD
jgi:hypothetical protein